jgi:hypothetical protein
MEPNRIYWPTVRRDIRQAFDDPTFQLPGWPGYRNRPGCSGLDPLATSFEEAHIQGRVIRMLLDRRWYTRNPIYVLALALYAITLIVSPILAIVPAISYSGKSVSIDDIHFDIFVLSLGFMIFLYLLNEAHKFIHGDWDSEDYDEEWVEE